MSEDGPMYTYTREAGMSLRDWFAGLAMQGLVSGSLGVAVAGGQAGAQPADIAAAIAPECIAASAVAYADALLAELAKARP